METQLPTTAELVQRISEGVKQMAPALERGMRNLRQVNEQLNSELKAELVRLKARQES
ncbi:hypothetical protein JAO77_20225 [Hymenobacter sp. BT559]|jgi:hypothetical protein|nr:hypothetical protein [Hymenobacter sp. BT559]